MKTEDLKKRPRCKNGSLDMRYKVNYEHFNKYDDVSDYYDPKNPELDLSLIHI